MTKLRYAVPCLFGLEGLAAEELRRLNMEDVRAENGRVTFSGPPEDLARALLWLRTGERVLVELGRFPAKSFEELFEGVRRTPLAELIPRDGAFPVKGYCLDSQLMSVPDCQAIVKKAAAKALGAAYGLNWIPETGALFQLQFAIMNDTAALYLDATGPGLHKRGYRAVGNAAPLRETLAAALVMLSRYRGREVFFDPFCGSGTIPIEAALIAKNRAPGLKRTFSAEHFPWLPQSAWTQARAEARDREFHGQYRILGADIDENAVSLAAANARKAGVGELIDFSRADAVRSPLPAEAGILIGNPPYGERMLERREAQRLYTALGRHLGGTDWSIYLLAAEPEFEHYFGRRADKRRKLYNGRIQCACYMYSPKGRKEEKP